MTFQQILLILRARWLVIVGVFALTVSAITGVTLVLPKTYSATASVVVDVKSPDLLTGLTSPQLVSTGVMATQMDIIRSLRVAKEVVSLLKLDQNPDVITMWRDSTGSKGVLSDWLASSLQTKLEVLPSRESSVVNITFSGNTPEYAAAVANAFAQAYINVSLGLRVGPARQYASFFEQQGKVALDRLETAQRALSDYQKASGITALDDRLDFESAKLNETSAQLTVLQGIATDSRSKRNSARTDTVAEVMQSQLVNQLKADIARLEGKINESSINLGSAHPLTRSQEAELATLRGKLDAEIRKIGASINTSDDINRQREGQLQAALAAQKSRVLQLNQQRDQLNVLKRNLDSSQRAYDQLLARADQTTIESQVNQANISVLNTATPPPSASKPKVFVNILLSVFLGTVLGVGIAFILELFNRRVRSTQELIDVLDMPLLGQVGSASKLINVKLLGAAK